MSYAVHMSTTLTVRTDDRLREALTRKAETLGKTVSQLVREILEDAIVERPMAGRIGHLRGALRLNRRDPDPWAKQLRERNWRP